MDRHRTPLELAGWQVDWVGRAMRMLRNNPFVIDTSQTGTGKTYTALYLSIVFNLPLLVICPAGLISTWRSRSEEHGAQVLDVISYDSLRGKKNSILTHGYLNRHDDRGEVTFSPTNKLINYVSRGVLLIFDEAHKMKNKSSAQSSSCAALVAPILENGGRSRTMLFSATIYTKAKCCVNFLRILGIVTRVRLIHGRDENGNVRYEGLQEVIDYCSVLDKPKVDQIIRENESDLRFGRADETCLLLYSQIIKKVVSGSHPPIAKIIETYPQDFCSSTVTNGFFNVGGTRMGAYLEALKRLERASGRTARQGTRPKVDLAAIGASMLETQLAKVDIFIRRAVTILSIPNAKYIIMVNYIKVVEALAEALEVYNPIVLTGKKSKVGKDRDQKVEKFMNDPDCRLLICIMSVGGVGLSFQDTRGDYPRFTDIASGYNMTEICQAAGRTIRYRMKSPATITIIYGKVEGEETLESRILDAMIKNTDVLRSVIQDQDETTTPLPGDYPEWVEPSEI